MNFLTPLERIIIESLNIKERTHQEISNDLGSKTELLFFPLQQLILKNIVTFHKDKYSLNHERLKDIKVHLEHSLSKKIEVKTILEAAKTQYFDHDSSKALRIKKAYLSSSDRSMIDSLLKQLEQFLNSREQKSKSEPLNKKEIFFWGHQTYNEVLKHLNCA